MTTEHTDRHGPLHLESLPADLVDRLRRLPDIDSPPALTAHIIAALAPRRRPWWQTFIFRLRRPRSITFTPVKWVPLGALAVLLTIGFGLDWLTGRPGLSHQPQTPPPALEAETRYQLGRRLLAVGQPREALEHLKHAADVQPESALYQFWLGVGYWSLEDLDRERAHYRAALQNDPEFLPAHVYIGHSYMDRGDWRLALQHYNRVLQAAPDHAEALFNTGIALYKLGDAQQENAAWRAYLRTYDRGAQALQAAERLNANGDFSFRRIQLGPLRFVKPAIRFVGPTAQLHASAKASLDDIGRIVDHNRKLELHVLAYVANDAETAAKRAKTIKHYLTTNFASIAPQRIKTSWFGVGENMPPNRQNYELRSSIRLFAVIVDAS